MMEYQKHIDFYAKDYWFSTSSNLVPYKDWGNIELAERYLQKYWLSEEEYLQVWKPIQDRIFIEGKFLPEMVYQTGFEIIALRGGCLFIEEDFKQLQNAMQDLGEDYFVIIQHTQEFMYGQPMFRMKFSVNITWEELISGNYISAVLLEMDYNEYFVFSSKGNWGKYSANDHEKPLDIIGFIPELGSVFKNHFNQPEEEEAEIREWLPQAYKVLNK